MDALLYVKYSCIAYTGETICFGSSLLETLFDEAKQKKSHITDKLIAAQRFHIKNGICINND